MFNVAVLEPGILLTCADLLSRYDLNIGPYPSLTWEEIKPAFVQAYQNAELINQLRSELTTLIQVVDEPVRSYFLRMQWILQRWPDHHDLPDGLLKDIFMMDWEKT